MDKAKVRELKDFIQLLKNDPQLIHIPDLDFFREYLASLGAQLPEIVVAEVEAEEEAFFDADDTDRMDEETEPLPASPDLSKLELSEAEQDRVNALKAEAQDAIDDGNREKALSLLSEAIVIGAVTAMLMTKRADLLLKLQRPRAAIKDCEVALSLNPDSGKAFRIRGLAYRYLHQWEKAHSDLAAAQRIDFDDATEEVHKLVDEKYRKMMESKRKAPTITSPPRRPAQAPQMPPGMGNMFADLLGDPELASAMTNPRVMQALQEMMSNPAALMQYQSDPEVGPVLMKLMSKFGGGGFPM